MAIIKNGLSMMMRGKVGAFSYYVSETRQIVRQAQNNSNYGDTATRSPQQQSRRVMWANLVNFYSVNKVWMKKAFEDLNPGVSVFNRFMQLNIPTAHVALNKTQAASKMWVLSPLCVSQGSLEAPVLNVYDSSRSSRVVVSQQITSDTTVGEVSQNILEKNDSYLNGDAIVAICFSGTTSNPLTGAVNPHLARYNYNEFVINVSDTRKFEDVYPYWSTTKNSRLVCDGMHDLDAYTYIHTRKQDGKLLVSTAYIIMPDDYNEMLDAWGSSSIVNAAAETYKVETPVMLAPGGNTRGNSGVDGGGSAPGGGGGDDDGNLGD